MKKKCKLNKKRKHLAYGQKHNGYSWCPICDLHLIPSINKKSERQKVKKEVKKEIISLFK